MKYIISLLCVFLSLSAMAQELRQCVVVVRPKQTESVIKFEKDFADQLERGGFVKAAKVMREAADNSFGSGFVVKDDVSGKLFLVTNSHVVGLAEYVDVEVLSPDSEKRTLEHCAVLSVHADYDLALVEIPDFANLKPLKLFEGKLADGDEVLSAGFPALAGAPSWQLGQGIVSNASIEMMEMTGGVKVGIIQHTAQVDGGSSGGPLLVRAKGDGNDRFRVVGVNTWKARDREGANFAQTAKMVKDFVAEVANKNLLSAENLEARAQDLIVAANKGYHYVSSFVALDYITSMSAKQFYEVLIGVKDKDCMEAMEHSFRVGDPMEGIRIGMGYMVWNHIISNQYKFDSVVSTSVVTGTGSTLCNGKGAQTTLSWVFEQGNWRLKTIASLNKNTMEKNGISRAYGMRTHSFYLGVGSPMGMPMMHACYTFEYDRNVGGFLIFGLDYRRWTARCLYDDYVKVGPDKYAVDVRLDLYDKKAVNDVSLVFGAQCPVKMGRFYAIPSLRLLTGLSSGHELYGFGFGGKAGLQFAYKVGYQTYLSLGAAYRLKGNFFVGDDMDKVYDNVNTDDMLWTKSAEIFVGITF